VPALGSRGRIAWIAVVFISVGSGVVLAAGCSEDRAGSADSHTSTALPVSVNERKLQEHLDRVLNRTLHGSYACVTLDAGQRRGEARTASAFVTTENARGAARAVLREELDGSRPWRVTVVSERFLKQTMYRLYNTIGDTVPLDPNPGTGEVGIITSGDPYNAVIIPGEPFDLTQCPRVVIGIEEPTIAAPELEAWATDALAAYGSDRTVIRRLDEHYRLDTRG
jgi:hypothetical protein